MTERASLLVPRREGRDIVLRPFVRDDVELVIEASSDPLIPLITTVPSTPDHAAAAAFIERQHDRARSGAGYSFAIESSGRAVGQIGLWLRDREYGRATIGYWIRPSARGAGAASRALACLVEFAWTLPELERLQLVVEPWNLASTRTAERVGFRAEGVLRGWERVGNERRDMLSYALLRDDPRGSSPA